MDNFYCFNSLNHTIQPTNSYWCWASCIEEMIKGLHSKSKIGSEQCELVSYYKTYKENKPDVSNKNCCPPSMLFNGCNLAIEEQHVEHMFKMSGFEIKKIDNNIIHNFENIKQILNNSKSPIVLKTQYDMGHMELIIGYGKKNGCEYILICNPTNVSDKYYTKLSSYNFNKVKAVWKTSLKNNTIGIEEDITLKNSFKYFNKFINENRKALKDKSDLLLDPFTYLTNSFSEAFKNFDIRNINLLVNQFSENIFKSGCGERINRVFEVVNDITHINKSKPFLTKKIDIRNNEILTFYLQEYITKIQVKKTNNTVYIKPFSYPLNYKLKNEWQTKKEFINEILTKPKTQAFNN